MGDSILGIGLSGLAAAQAGLLTTGHNVSNVNTPGYNRQETVQTSRVPLLRGGGFIGQGVNVATVRRVYSDFLAARTLTSQSDATALSARHDQLAQLDNLFGDQTSGLAPALDDFFAGMNTLAANPADVPARQSALSAAQALVSRFHQLDGQLSELRQSANDRIQGAVATINTFGTQIAALNRRISDASAGGAAELPPNDLLDQRDALVMQLNAQIGATAVQQSDGSYNVFLSNGQALVVGQQAQALIAGSDPADPQNLQVALKTAGAAVRFHSADLTGGELGGILAFRDHELTQAQNELGRVALALGSAVNAQHQLGQDLNGVPGGNFFRVAAPVTQNAATNTGTASLAVSVADATEVAASDYRLEYDGAAYTLTRLVDNTAQTFGALPQTVDGLAFSLATGVPAAGDSFLIQPTRAVARDFGVAVANTAQIAAAAPVRTAASSTNSGTGAVSAGRIDGSYPAAPLTGPVTLTFASATSLLAGFPATQAVTVTASGTATTYPLGAPVPYTSGATIAFGGLSFTLSGAPANGDTFTVAPNTGGIGDNRNAQLLAGLSRERLVAGGTSTFNGAYAQLVSGVGSATQEAGVESDAQSRLLAQAQAAQSATSGVNLDEEAANLQRYQQAYLAAGKMMAIASSLFQTILDLGRN